MSSNDDIVQGFTKIAREIESLEAVPEPFVEIVQIALDSETGLEDLETAAVLMSPSDLRAAREFCLLFRDSHAGDTALAEGLEALEGLLSETAADAYASPGTPEGATPRHPWPHGKSPLQCSTGPHSHDTLRPPTRPELPPRIRSDPLSRVLCPCRTQTHR